MRLLKYSCLIILLALFSSCSNWITIEQVLENGLNQNQIKSNLKYVVESKKGFGILVGILRDNYEQIYKQCGTFIGPIIGADYDKYKSLCCNSETGVFAVSSDFGIKMGVFIEAVELD